MTGASPTLSFSLSSRSIEAEHATDPAKFSALHVTTPMNSFVMSSMHRQDTLSLLVIVMLFSLFCLAYDAISVVPTNHWKEAHGLDLTSVSSITMSPKCILVGRISFVKTGGVISLSSGAFSSLMVLADLAVTCLVFSMTTSYLPTFFLSTFLILIVDTPSSTFISQSSLDVSGWLFRYHITLMSSSGSKVMQSSKASCSSTDFAISGSIITGPSSVKHLIIIFIYPFFQ